MCKYPSRKIVTLCAAVLAAAPGPWAGAARPLTLDDANTVPHKVWQIEAGAGYVGTDDRDHYDLPVAVTYGLGEDLAVGAGFGAQWEWRDASVAGDQYVSDVRDVVAAFKWRFAREDE